MLGEPIWQDVARIRSSAPLVHNITNFVVMNNTANALLALGASPVMAHAPEEVVDFATTSGALVLNIGTLSSDWIAAMREAGCAARSRGVPVVLDPVGSGATGFRTRSSLELIEVVKPTVVRGNASEILSLAIDEHGTRGVDSAHSTEVALPAATALALRSGAIVSISGEVDLITNGRDVFAVRNGHHWMPRITGMGCTATALTGAFLAVQPDPFLAAAHAMVVNGLAGELAARTASGPGSFQVAFIDALFKLDHATLLEMARLERRALT